MHARIFSTELFWTCLVWLLIATILGVVAFGIWRENWHMERTRLGLPHDVAEALRTLCRRNSQVWGVLLILVILDASNDIRHALASFPVDFFTAPATKSSVAKIQSNTSAHTASAPAMQLPASRLPFSDITEFNESNSKQQAYIDLLKQRYEAWLVTYYYLNKCGETGAQDFDLIKASLRQELTSMHADSTVQNNILLAATGSYTEMYRNIPCDRQHLVESKSSYDANLQQLQKLHTAGSGQ